MHELICEACGQRESECRCRLDFMDWYQPPKPQMERWWECYVEGTDGGRHYRHWNLVTAQKEAERLARLTKMTVYLFECVGQCRTEETPVKWEIPR